MTNKELGKLANVNYIELLDKLGISYRDRGRILQACCPAVQHNGDGDNTSAFCYKIESGHWRCYTHFCQEEYGSDVFGLVRSVLGCSFNQSKEWLEKFINDEDIDFEIPKEIRGSYGFIGKNPKLGNNIVRFLRPSDPPKYLLDRGFSAEVLKKYEVGSWYKLGTFMHDRVIFPVRDESGCLVGFTGRVNGEVVGDNDKWIHGRSYQRWPNRSEFFTSKLIFNLNNVKDNMSDDKTVILVEGPLDVLKMEMAGIHNSVATLGLNFLTSHRELLIKSGVNNIRCAYDPDIAGDKAYERLIETCGSYVDVEKVELPGKDPGDMTEVEILEIFHGT